MAAENEVRDQIIEAAVRMYKKWGLKKTTMEDIASEAGKGKATLYYYFKTKEDVFRSVVEKEIAAIHQTVKGKTDQVASASDKLKIYLETMFEEGRQRVLVYSVLQAEVKGNKSLMVDLRESFDAYEIHLIKEIIQNGMTTGEFIQHTEDELSTLAFAISSFIRSMLFQLIVEQDLPEESVRLETVGNFLIRGLRK